MSRVFLITIITIIITTALVCMINPKMHKRAVILDSRYKVVDVAEPVVTQTQAPIQTPVVKIEEPTAVSRPKTAPVKVTTTVPAKVQQVKTKAVKQTVKTVASPKTTSKLIKTTPPLTKNSSVKTQQQQAPSKPTVTKTEPPKQLAAKPVLTKQEEAILWNKWRSNLQNSIMDSVPSMPVPLGTVFKFSFTVDKNGRITNIKSWSTDSKYNPYAIKYITPVIRSYQGKSILKFPEGSNRDSTVFEGKMRLSNSSKYSTANDYNDVERIRY